MSDKEKFCVISTDQDIIKVLRCIAKCDDIKCSDCEIDAYCSKDKIGIISANAADLIEQQVTEINELQKSLNDLGHANACLRGQIPEWIDVKDRLPDKGGNYLCRYGFQRDGCLGDYRTTGCLYYYAYDHRPHWQHESVGLFVTHWMPLPEPPEERKGGEG